MDLIDDFAGVQRGEGVFKVSQQVSEKMLGPESQSFDFKPRMLC